MSTGHCEKDNHNHRSAAPPPEEEFVRVMSLNNTLDEGVGGCGGAIVGGFNICGNRSPSSQHQHHSAATPTHHRNTNHAHHPNTIAITAPITTTTTDDESGGDSDPNKRRRWQVPGQHTGANNCGAGGTPHMRNVALPTSAAASSPRSVATVTATSISQEASADGAAVVRVTSVSSPPMGAAAMGAGSNTVTCTITPAHPTAVSTFLPSPSTASVSPAAGTHLLVAAAPSAQPHYGARSPVVGGIHVTHSQQQRRRYDSVGPSATAGANGGASDHLITNNKHHTTTKTNNIVRTPSNAKNSNSNGSAVSSPVFALRRVFGGKAVLSVTCVAVTAATFLIALTAAVVVAVSVSYSLSAADAFAQSYSTSNVVAAVNKVNDFLSIPLDAYVYVKKAVALGYVPDMTLVPVANLTARREHYEVWLRHMQPMLYAAQFNLLYVAWGLEDGSWLDCHILDKAVLKHQCTFSNYYNATYRADGGRAYREGHQYVDTEFIGLSWVDFDYDPRRRPWYATNNNSLNAQPIISEVYVDFALSVPIVDINGPFHDANGKLIGVTSISLDVNQISKLLTLVSMTPNGLAILVDRMGLVLGGSDERDLFYTNPYEPTRDGPIGVGCEQFADPADATILFQMCRHSPLSYANPTLNAIAGAAPNVFIANGQSLTREIDVKIRGRGNSKEAWVISTGGITAATDTADAAIAWQMVTMMPVSDVTGPIVTGRNIAIILACVMAVVSCVMCAAALLVLLHPLRALSEKMMRASELRDDSLAATTAEEKSMMKEIRSIQESFERLGLQLQKAKSFLPAALLAQLEGTTDEDADLHDDEHDDDDGNGNHNRDDDDDEGSIDLDGPNSGRRRKRGRRHHHSGGGGRYADFREFDDDEDAATTNTDAASSSHVSRFTHATHNTSEAHFYGHNNGSETPNNGHRTATTIVPMTTMKKKNGGGGTRKGGGGAPHSSNHSTSNSHTNSLTENTYQSRQRQQLLLSQQQNLRSIASGVSLVSKNITIAALNIRGFHSVMFYGGGGGGTGNTSLSLSVEARYARLVDAFQTIAKDHKGMLDSFHGDKFYFTFNAVKHCSSHAAMGATAMLRIAEEMEMEHMGIHPHEQDVDGGAAAAISCGIATGRCLVGNMGSDRAKRFTVVGPAFTTATVLERLCKHYPSPQEASVLLSKETLVESDTHIGAMLIDYVRLPTAHQQQHHQYSSSASAAVPIAAARYTKHSNNNAAAATQLSTSQNNTTNGPNPNTMVSTAAAAFMKLLSHSNNNTVNDDDLHPNDTAHHHNNKNHDEWMYEVTSAENKCNFYNSNKAFRAAIAGDWEGAQQFLAMCEAEGSSAPQTVLGLWVCERIRVMIAEIRAGLASCEAAVATAKTAVTSATHPSAAKVSGGAKAKQATTTTAAAKSTKAAAAAAALQLPPAFASITANNTATTTTSSANNNNHNYALAASFVKPSQLGAYYDDCIVGSGAAMQPAAGLLSQPIEIVFSNARN